MKWTGLGALALAAVVTLACERTANDDSVISDRDDRETIGTSGRADDPGLDLGVEAGDSREFVRDVSIANRAEVQMGQLGVERAQSNEVKQFAQMMIRDHTKAGKELEQAVARHDVTVAAETDDKHRDVLNRLRGLRGAEFDREFMTAMVEGHQDARDLVAGRADDRRATGTSGIARTDTVASDEALDAAVSQWASKTLPTIESHLKRARQIRDQVYGARNSTAY
jgi:putative membrane protein